MLYRRRHRKKKWNLIQSWRKDTKRFHRRLKWKWGFKTKEVKSTGKTPWELRISKKLPRKRKSSFYRKSSQKTKNFPSTLDITKSYCSKLKTRSRKWLRKSHNSKTRSTHTQHRLRDNRKCCIKKDKGNPSCFPRSSKLKQESNTTNVCHLLWLRLSARHSSR